MKRSKVVLVIVGALVAALGMIAASMVGFVVIRSSCRPGEALTYHAASFVVEYVVSSEACVPHDTTDFRELWVTVGNRFRERRYSVSDPARHMSRLRVGTDTTFVFFPDCDTLYMVRDTAPELVPRPPLLFSREDLAGHLVTASAARSTGKMQKFYRSTKTIRGGFKAEEIMWIDRRSHLIALRHAVTRYDTCREFWLWQTWNLCIAESLFHPPENMRTTWMDRTTYEGMIDQPNIAVAAGRVDLHSVRTWFHVVKQWGWVLLNKK